MTIHANSLKRHRSRIMRLSLVLTLCLFVSGFAFVDTHAAMVDSGANQDERFAGIDAFVDAEMHDLRIPGLALGIVQDDQIVHLKGFGVADVASGRPVTPQTPFHIASLGKSFTALAVMQLVEAGKIELDAPVQRYLPWFRVADEQASAQITVRHLLNQTSGIPAAASDTISGLQRTGADAIEESVHDLSTVQLTRPVGAAFEYANLNYVTLGLIVQTVSGEAYAQYIQQHIFAPLAMTNAYMDPAEDRARGAAQGHAYWFDIPRPAPMPPSDGMRPAGGDGFAVSAEAMSHYLIAQLNEGRYGAVNVLSPKGIAALHQPTTPTNEPGNFYGMGWEQITRNGLPVVRHDGGIFTFHSEMALLPSEHWGVVVLINSSPELRVLFGDQRFATIVPGIIDLLQGRQPPIQPANHTIWLVYAFFLLLFISQGSRIARLLVLVRRWRIDSEERPNGWRRQLQTWLPLALNLLWVLIILVGIPAVMNNSLTSLAYGLPDLVAMLRISAVVALGWGILRTVLVIVALHNRQLSVTAVAQPT